MCVERFARWCSYASLVQAVSIRPEHFAWFILQLANGSTLGSSYIRCFWVPSGLDGKLSYQYCHLNVVACPFARKPCKWDTVVFKSFVCSFINIDLFLRKSHMKTVLHYIDVIMDAMASQITSLTIVSSTVYSGANQRNIKALRHWPLWGEFTGDRWIPRKKGPLTRKMVPFDDVIMARSMCPGQE